ncbi:MAG TPA: PQQ-binding-like beta-propeller repeat protein [Acidimicrobiia bacterium]|nr:PQQ-binding-like beta-propeller repeat protein [Acidimicrobiia bacterium]
MTTPPRSSRRIRRAAAAVGVAAAVALALPAPAPAAAGTAAATAPSGPAVKPDSGTWGTAAGGGGRAQLATAVVEHGGRAYIGGSFTKMTPPGGGSGVTRNRLAAIDVARRKLLPWNPKANGKVRALALNASKTAVYVGGDFSSIGGKSASKLALVDLASGKVDTKFRPAVKGRVRSIALAGNRLYVGGDFESVGGKARPKVAALDPVTGKLLDWAPPPLGPGRYMGQTGVPTPDRPSGDVYSVAAPADGSRVYVAGTFIDFAGQGGLVALDADSGLPLPKQWSPGRPVFHLTVSPGDGRTVYAAAGGPGGRLYALDPDKPTKPRWQAAVDGDAVGVAASATQVFLLGHYDYIVPKGSTCYQYCPNGTGRRHLAAFDAATGTLAPWNPAANTSTGPWAATVSGTHLIVVGEFTTINGQRHPGYAQFPRKD